MEILESGLDLLREVLDATVEGTYAHIDTGSESQYDNFTVNWLATTGWIEAEAKAWSEPGSIVQAWHCTIAPGQETTHVFELWDGENHETVVESIQMSYAQANRWNGLLRIVDDKRRFIPAPTPEYRESLSRFMNTMAERLVFSPGEDEDAVH